MKLAEQAERYTSDGKDTSRALVMHECARNRPETILDLYGSGISTRMFRSLMPTAAITTCETDKRLWPVVRQESQRLGVGFHLGDFAKAGGKYDFINLDLCAQWSGKSREDVVAAGRMLADGGLLAVTLMRARETPEIAADRWFVVPASLERAAKAGIQWIYPYQSKVPMWTFFLRRGARVGWPYMSEPFRPAADVFDMAAIAQRDVARHGIFGDPDFDYDRICTSCDKPEYALKKGCKTKHDLSLMCACESPKWRLAVPYPTGAVEVAA